MISASLKPNYLKKQGCSSFLQSTIAEGRRLKNYSCEQEHVLFSNMSWIETTTS